MIVNVSEAKTNLSKLIDMVYHGEQVTIAKNNREDEGCAEGVWAVCLIFLFTIVFIITIFMIIMILIMMFLSMRKTNLGICHTHSKV